MFSKERNCSLVMIVVVGLLAHMNATLATNYTIGGDKGWYFYADKWAAKSNILSFKEGDILVFKYDPNDHNVVIVDKASYDSCKVPKSGAITLVSGNDQIQLGKEPTYIICGFYNHCGAGMRIAAITS